MVKRKRSQLGNDESEEICVLDNTDTGKVIKLKKRKIKQANQNKKTKKVQSPMMNKDPVNHDITQDSSNKDHDNSPLPSSFFKKASKIIPNNNKTKSKR